MPDEFGVISHTSPGVPALALGDLEPYPFSTPAQSPLENAVRGLGSSVPSVETWPCHTLVCMVQTVPSTFEAVVQRLQRVYRRH